MNPVEDFFDFINERQNIFMRRFDEGLPPPWSKNNAITDFHYTNVYRELDRGTVFYIKFVARNDNHTPQSRFFWTLVYRIFNKIETYTAIMPYTRVYAQDGYEDPHHWYKNTILAKIQTLDKPFTNAFMVTGSVYPNMDKPTQMVTALDEIHEKLQINFERVNKAKSLREAWEAIRTLPGFGPFLAYEVVCDLMYAHLIKFSEDDWANIGPGARKGLWEIWPELDEQDQYKSMVWLKDNQGDYLDTLGFKRVYWYNNPSGHLSLRNIEHSLCEYSKYKRAQRGERMKRKWHGITLDDGWYRDSIEQIFGIGKGFNPAEPKGV